MLMPKATRVSIYEHLFKEGVMVAKKDLRPTCKHTEVDVRNLYVVKALASLKSRGYVREQFAWRHYYWFLTNEGITYLREFLHLPPEIVPATLKRSSRPGDAGTRDARGGRGGDDDSRGPAPGADRLAYRRNISQPEDGASGKEVGAGTGADFQFKGGFGRGKPTGAPPATE